MRNQIGRESFVDACNLIKKEKGTINVYAIAYRFGTANSAAQQDLKNCVHGSGKFYEANNSNLVDVFKSIGNNITRVRLGS